MAPPVGRIGSFLNSKVMDLKGKEGMAEAANDFHTVAINHPS